MTSIRPFQIHVDDEILDDLAERLRRARLPNWITAVGAEQGIAEDTFERLLQRWRSGYDWRPFEARLARFDHYMTDVDRQPIHFVHVRSPRADAVPLVLIHGWPGGFHEFLDVIPLLTDPSGDGLAFDVIVPSVPGFGWSAPTVERGWNAERTAAALVEIVDRLGYDRFGVQGGDVGSVVAPHMARLAPERTIGLHLNMCLIEPYDGAPEPTPAEQAEQARLATSRQTSMGYYIQQSTKPQTLGIALEDSPVGLLAWIAEKLEAWSDCDGDLFRVFSVDQVLDWITLYWVTSSITSSLRIYWEGRMASRQQPAERLTVPTGVVDFPGERARSPRAWIEDHYDLVHFTSQPRGGHFAAAEQPELFAADVRAFFELVAATGG